VVERKDSGGGSGGLGVGNAGAVFLHFFVFLTLPPHLLSVSPSLPDTPFPSGQYNAKNKTIYGYGCWFITRVEIGVEIVDVSDECILQCYKLKVRSPER
jgi:hypothetical protein